MNLLITGGAGFIGSHLTDRLLAQGHAIICADKLEMGNQNIRHLEACSRFRRKWLYNAACGGAEGN